jgi:hypothetical protein
MLTKMIQRLPGRGPKRTNPCGLTTTVPSSGAIGKANRATVGPLEREDQVIITLLLRGNCRSALDRTPELFQMSEEDLFGIPLRQAALELVRTTDAGEAAARQRQESRPTHACPMDVDSEAQERVDGTGAGEHLERGGLDRRSPCLMVRLGPMVHDPGADTVPGKLAGN